MKERKKKRKEKKRREEKRKEKTKKRKGKENPDVGMVKSTLGIAFEYFFVNNPF